MKNKIALIIGRFQPFHLGHWHLIKRYHNAGFLIKIAIGSCEKSFKKDNPLTSIERKEIIENAMREFKIKNYELYYVPDINKHSQYVNHVLKIVGKFDIIITGNPIVLKTFKDYKSKKPWNIESFEEFSGRPGGEISASAIREIWLKSPSKKHLPKSTFDYLKSINFTERLRKINSS